MRSLVIPMVLVSAVASAEPELELGQPKLDHWNPRSSGDVAATIEGHKDAFLACYRAAKNPPDGEVTVVLVIRPDGVVTGAGTSGFDREIDACLKVELKKLHFPKLPEKATVDYAWTFYDSAHTVGAGAFASLTGTGDISSGFDDTNIYGGLLGTEAGTGGGGTGWGTIGTGRYGTIGHGAGHGGMRGRTAAVPTISIGQPTVGGKGTLDKAIIRRYIKRNAQKLQYCYEKELLAKPKLAGTISASFTITANGEVAPGAKASGIAVVDACVASVVQTILFPKPKNDAEVTVVYPFSFRPSGS